MKKLDLTIHICVILYVFITSCSQDDGGSNNTSTIANITVLGKSSSAIFQADVASNSPEVATYNLTQDSGVDVNSFIMETNNNDDQIGFYFYSNFNFNGFTIWEKNLITNQTTTYPIGFCNEASSEETYFPRITENYITEFVVEPSGTSSSVLSLRVFNKNSQFCSKLIFGSVSQFQSLRSVIIDNIIYTYHFNSANEAFITKLNLETLVVEDQLTFNERGYATIKDDKLYYIKNGDNSQQIYNLQTFELLDTMAFNTNVFLNDGLYKPQIRNNALLIDVAYPQPSLFITYPALLDLNSGEVTLLADLTNVRNNLIPLLTEALSVDISDLYAVDLNNNILVGTYTVLDSNSVENYGVYFADFDGTIISQTSITFPVQEIIFR